MLHVSVSPPDGTVSLVCDKPVFFSTLSFASEIFFLFEGYYYSSAYEKKFKAKAAPTTDQWAWR